MPDAAWLPDPTGRFQYRYWDGSQWSASVSRQGSQETDVLTQPPPPLAPPTAPLPPPPPRPDSTAGSAPPPPIWGSPSPGVPPSEASDWSAGMRVAVLVSVAVLLVGSCLTWVKASAGGFSVTRGGLSGDGRITIAIAIAVD